MNADNIRLGQSVKVPAYRLLGLPEAIVTVIERRSRTSFVVRYPNGETLTVYEWSAAEVD